MKDLGNPQEQQISQARRGLARIPSGVFWTLVAVVVLGLVYSYDQRGRQEALKRVDKARNLVAKGQYLDAVMEYRVAMEHPRLGNRDKARVALGIADIYDQHLNDPAKAAEYVAKARRFAPKLVEDAKVGTRPAQVAKKDDAAGAASATTAASKPFPQMPPQDSEGPVVAEYAGKALHAGAVARVLGELPAFHAALDDKETTDLDDLIMARLEEVLALQAAEDEGLDRDPDLIARVHDYRATLLVDRYVSAKKRAAAVITTGEVQKYYDENQEKYNEPARLGLALIQTATSDTAAKALSDLRAGVSFSDVASSYSDHLESKSKAGVVGLITANSPSIPGVGENLDVVASLFKMNPNEISGVTEIGGKFYLFKVMTKYQARRVTVDEVRGQIENLLKRRREESAASSIVQDLVKRYNARLLPDAAASMRRYVAQRSSPQAADTETTAPAGPPDPR